MGSMWTSPVRSFSTFLPPAPPCRSSSFVVCQSSFTWRRRIAESACLLFSVFRLTGEYIFLDLFHFVNLASIRLLIPWKPWSVLSIRMTNSTNGCYSCSVFNQSEVQYLRVLLPQLQQLKKKTLYITNPKLAVLSKMKIEDNFATFLTACFVLELEDTGCQKF